MRHLPESGQFQILRTVEIVTQVQFEAPVADARRGVHQHRAVSRHLRHGNLLQQIGGFARVVLGRDADAVFEHPQVDANVEHVVLLPAQVVSRTERLRKGVPGVVTPRTAVKRPPVVIIRRQVAVVAVARLELDVVEYPLHGIQPRPVFVGNAVGRRHGPEITRAVFGREARGAVLTERAPDEIAVAVGIVGTGDDRDLRIVVAASAPPRDLGGGRKHGPQVVEEIDRRHGVPLLTEIHQFQPRRRAEAVTSVERIVEVEHILVGGLQALRIVVGQLAAHEVSRTEIPVEIVGAPAGM